MEACTITTRRSLAATRVLASSFLEHHPGSSFTALVLDDRERTIGGEGFAVLRPGEIGIEEALFQRLAFLNDAAGLSLATLPWFLGELLERGARELLFLSPQWWVRGPLDDLRAHLGGRALLAAPLVDARPTRSLTPGEDVVLRVFGSLDPGFTFLAPSATALLTRWRSTVESHVVPVVGFRPLERFVLTGEAALLPDGNGVGSLVALERARTGSDELPAGAGREPTAVHFLHADLGPSPVSPDALRSFAERTRAPGLADLCRGYASELERAGRAADGGEYGFDRLPGGVPIDERMRLRYMEALHEGAEGADGDPPEPFSEPEAFLGWLNETPGGGQRTERVEVPPADGLEPGLNVVGPFDCAHGLGEASRQILAVIRASGIRTATALSSIGISRPDLVFEVDGLARARFDTNLLCVNINEILDFARRIPPGLFQGRYTIGYWWWEVSRVPDELRPAFELVDEVWVGSRFVRDALAAYTDKPVVDIPFAAELPAARPTRPRAELGLPEGFVFLFVFDFYSRIERKNPMALIRAFREAFRPGEGAWLVLKSVNGARELPSLERLRYEARGRPDILLVDDYLPAAVKEEWLASCDCYVSLHRSEGFGLTMAEAMALGKPVIATAYSGNMSFMTEETSYLVPFELTTVPASEALYPAGAVWADPDVARAAALMRRVFEERDEAARVGARASAHVRSLLVPERAVSVIRERLQSRSRQPV